MYFKYVICIVVYCSKDDLITCIKSIKKIHSYKIIIINSYHDEKTKSDFEVISKKYKCDFINVSNKGYGYGNNRGIEYAVNKYKFDYMIISNPDIVIKKFNDRVLLRNTNCIIAPMITTRKGKAQNPYWYLKNKIAEKFIYIGLKYQVKSILFTGYALNKIIRELGLFIFNHSKKKDTRIYAAHGCFCIFPFSVLEILGLPYDENMFLFAEEAYLSHILEIKKIRTLLTKDIKIIHMEDGCISIAKIDESSELRKSVVYYYEKLKKI